MEFRTSVNLGLLGEGSTSKVLLDFELNSDVPCNFQLKTSILFILKNPVFRGYLYERQSAFHKDKIKQNSLTH